MSALHYSVSSRSFVFILQLLLSKEEITAEDDGKMEEHYDARSIMGRKNARKSSIVRH